MVWLSLHVCESLVAGTKNWCLLLAQPELQLPPKGNETAGHADLIVTKGTQLMEQGSLPADEKVEKQPGSSE